MAAVIETVKEPVQERNNRSLHNDIRTLESRIVTALVAPTANDDIRDGYVVGNLWVDTVGLKAYICIANTPAAADWDQIN